MEIIEAIKSRRSVRSFKPDPVSNDILLKVLEAARWAPSSFNSQSWEFVVLTGEALEVVKKANLEQFDRQVPPHHTLGNPVLTGVYRQRQVAHGIALYQLLGIGREDKQKRDEWSRHGLGFHHAPAAILICADNETPEIRAVFEAGVVTQTIALAAMQFGLGTCIMGAPVYYPGVIRPLIGIPESKRIYMALAVGYPDWDHPANKLPPTREAVDALTTWRG